MTMCPNEREVQFKFFAVIWTYKKAFRFFHRLTVIFFLSFFFHHKCVFS